MSDLNIQEVFGQFAVKIGTGIKMFDSEAEATTAAVLEARSVEFQETAQAFTESAGITGKGAKTQQNVVIAFLVYQSTQPESEVSDEVGADFVADVEAG